MLFRSNEPISESLGNARIYLPNIFTPNGDGVNDYFFLYGDSIRKIELLEIRNTRNKVVYQIKDVEANDYTTGWDGKENGNVVRGLYSVTLVVEAIDGTIGEFESTVCNYPCGQAEEMSAIQYCHYSDDWWFWQWIDGCLYDDLPECFE